MNKPIKSVKEMGKYVLLQLDFTHKKQELESPNFYALWGNFLAIMAFLIPLPCFFCVLPQEILDVFTLSHRLTKFPMRNRVCLQLYFD